MVISKYNATGYAMKSREEVLGYGFLMVGFSLLVLTINLYYKAMWYWIPLFFVSVMFLIIGFGLLGVK